MNIIVLYYLFWYSSFKITSMSLLLLLIPLFGIGLVSIDSNYGLFTRNNIKIKWIALLTSIINLIISLVMFIIFDFSSKQFQFIEERKKLNKRNKN